MTGSIQGLANMEYALYGNMAGGYGAYNAPSVVNGYCAQSRLANNYPYYYNNMQNDVFTPSNTQKTDAEKWGGGTYQKAETVDISTDMDKIANYYANNNALEEGFKGAAAGGLSWMAFEHAQSLVHPHNAFLSKNTGVSQAEKVFKNIAKDKAFMKENSVLMQEAYTAVQQATRDTGKKWFFSGLLRKPIDKAAIEPLVKDMEAALLTKKPNKIALATERLQAARGFDGKLIPKFISKSRTVAERLADKSTPKKAGKPSEIAKNVEGLLARNSGKIGTITKQIFKKDFVGFLIFETVFGIGKITKAFQHDKETGIKQTGQTVGKAALGTAGWCIGRAAGTWLGAKAGAAIGSMICPGAGTLIGGLIGFTVGSIGMWAGHKLGNAILGKDTADKAEAEALVKTPEGQAKLLELTVPIAEQDKNLPPDVRQAFENIAAKYSTAA